MVHKNLTDVDFTPHPAETDLLSMLKTADPDTGKAVADARKAGLTWPTILAFVVKYGAQAAAVIQEILTALKTPAPAPQSPEEEHEAELLRAEVESKRREARKEAAEHAKHTKEDEHGHKGHKKE